MLKKSKQTKKSKKPKVGFYGITGCAGCLLSFIFNEDEILDLLKFVDIVAFPFVKEVNIDDNFDYVFLEGLVADNEDLQIVKKLRNNSKILISLGSCACTGCVPAYRHYTLHQNYEHLLYQKDNNIQDVDPTPVDMHVKADFHIPGCPPNKKEILTFIKSIVIGKKPRFNENPVCFECRKNENQCLLDKGKPCMGPITAGGCNSVCINGGFECWGCRGPINDMNIELLIKIIKKMGYDDDFIKNRLRTFAGLKLPVIEKIINEVKCKKQ